MILIVHLPPVPAAVHYLESIGKVVACGGLALDDPTKCFAFDGASWSPLPDSTQNHCFIDTPNLSVGQGWWLSGLTQVDTEGLCSSDWTSEILTEEGWVPGPQHALMIGLKDPASSTSMPPTPSTLEAILPSQKAGSTAGSRANGHNLGRSTMQGFGMVVQT